MNIFVAKINFKTESESLEKLFETFGEVDSAKVIYDKATGRSKGFAFVEMPNDEEAEEAISKLDGTEFEGRTIVVKKSEPKPRSDRRPPRDNYRDQGYNQRY